MISRNIVLLLFALVVIPNVLACERGYGTSEAEVQRHKRDVKKELLKLPCVSPQLKAMLKEDDKIQHRHPRIERDMLEGLLGILEGYREGEAAHMTCEQLMDATGGR